MMNQSEAVYWPDPNILRGLEQEKVALIMCFDAQGENQQVNVP